MAISYAPGFLGVGSSESSAFQQQLRLLYDLLQILITLIPQVWVAFYQAGNITKIFEFLALSSFRITPRFDLSAQCVF